MAVPEENETDPFVEGMNKIYKQIMTMLEEDAQAKKSRKQQGSEEKTTELGKGKISSLKEAMQNMSKSPDTKEILKQIKEKAQKEHPKFIYIFSRLYTDTNQLHMLIFLL